MKLLANKQTRVLLGLIAFGVTGGAAFMFVKLLVGELTPLQLTGGRVVTAAVPLLVMSALARSLPRLSSELLRGLTILAVLDTIAPYLLIAWAQLHVNSSTAGLLIGTMPLFTASIVAVTGREEAIAPTALAGLCTGFLGVALLAGPAAFQAGSASSLGVLAAVASAALYASAAVYSRTLMHLADPLGLSSVKLVIASLLLVPLAVAGGGLNAYGALSTHGWLALFMVGFVSTGIGRCVYQWVIVEAGSVRASLVTYIVPLVAILLGWLVLKEAVTAATIAAALLIASGVAGVLYGAQMSRLVAAVAQALARLRASELEPVTINQTRVH
jgi:drug/metabolite transporter (DMT)-like permease